MTHTEILEKAIQRAVKGGFYSFAGGAFGDTEFVVVPKDRFGQIKVHVKDWPDEYCSAEAIIYDHDFAKALWGEEPADLIDVNAPKWSMYDILMAQAAWRAHLQQMVIADDPIAYLGAHLPE